MSSLSGCVPHQSDYSLPLLPPLHFTIPLDETAIHDLIELDFRLDGCLLQETLGPFPPSSDILLLKLQISDTIRTFHHSTQYFETEANPPTTVWCWVHYNSLDYESLIDSVLGGGRTMVPVHLQKGIASFLQIFAANAISLTCKNCGHRIRPITVNIKMVSEFMPVSKSLIVGLEKVKFDGSTGKMASECSICLEEFVDGNDVQRMPCSHIYHQDCIDQWLETSETHSCPLCRFNVPFPR